MDEITSNTTPNTNGSEGFLNQLYSFLSILITVVLGFVLIWFVFFRKKQKPKTPKQQTPDENKIEEKSTTDDNEQPVEHDLVDQAKLWAREQNFEQLTVCTT